MATNVNICGFGPENQDISWETMISLKQWLCLLSEDYGKKPKTQRGSQLRMDEVYIPSYHSTVYHVWTNYEKLITNVFFANGTWDLPTCSFTTKNTDFPNRDAIKNRARLVFSCRLGI